MEQRAPDPAKLLEAWMEWERGETPPGRVMSNLKTAGMRQLLDDLAAASPGQEPVVSEVGPDAVAAWTPTV
jgi:hypothetical protein